MSRGPRGNDLDDTLDQVDALYAQAQEAIGAYSPETAAGLLDRADAWLAGSTDSADSAESSEAPGETTGGLALLRAAIVHRRGVRATYTSGNGAPRDRHLRPLGLVAKAGAWYLIADDGRGPRTFRTSRLAGAHLTDGNFNPPTDFDLAGYWKAHARELENLRSGVAATLRVPSWAVPVLQRQFGRYCTVADADTGRSIVEVRAHQLTGLAEQLAGWGNRIDVLPPADLRAELRRIGTDLAAHHTAPPADVPR